MTVSSLLVGLGNIGMGYDLAAEASAYVLTHARALTLHESFSLTAGVDPDAGRRALFEQAYQRPAYATLTAALDAQRPELVVIAAPTAQHSAVLRSVLEAHSVSTILCEKPLSYDVSEAREMVARCAARDVALFVNYMRRSDAAVIEVKRRIDDGRIRGPLKGVAWYSKGLLHNGSHLFNLLQYWLGAVERSQMVDRGRDWGDHDSEPDVQVVFERGTVLFLAAREEAYSHYTVELVCGNGRLRYDGGGERVQWQPAVPDPVVSGYVTLAKNAEEIPSGMSRSQWHVMCQLSSALDGARGELCSGADALSTIESLSTLLEAR